MPARLPRNRSLLDPRRHGGAGQPRPQGRLDRAAGRARGARRRPEGAAGGQEEYGWREPGLARRPRRSRQARAAPAGVPDWKSARTTNAIEPLHEEFKRRIRTQTVLPSAETAAMLFWALLASGQITMPRVDGWQSPTQKLTDKPPSSCRKRAW
jgi:hypothetical protein